MNRSSWLGFLTYIHHLIPNDTVPTYLGVLGKNTDLLFNSNKMKGECTLK